MSASPNLKLPFIDANQNQKSVTHNAALTILDALVNCQVQSAALAAPPASPADGQCWIVAVGGSGAWTGKDFNVAAWQDGAWSFYPPTTGMLAYNDATGGLVVWTGTAWAPVTSGGGGGGAVSSVAGRTGAVTLAVADVSGAAPLASPALTGSPTAPTRLPATPRPSSPPRLSSRDRALQRRPERPRPLRAERGRPHRRRDPGGRRRVRARRRLLRLPSPARQPGRRSRPATTRRSSPPRLSSPRTMCLPPMRPRSASARRRIRAIRCRPSSIPRCSRRFRHPPRAPATFASSCPNRRPATRPPSCSRTISPGGPRSGSPATTISTSRSRPTVQRSMTPSWSRRRAARSRSSARRPIRPPPRPTVRPSPPPPPMCRRRALSRRPGRPRPPRCRAWPAAPAP